MSIQILNVDDFGFERHAWMVTGPTGDVLIIPGGGEQHCCDEYAAFNYDRGHYHLAWASDYSEPIDGEVQCDRGLSISADIMIEELDQGIYEYFNAYIEAGDTVTQGARVDIVEGL